MMFLPILWSPTGCEFSWKHILPVRVPLQYIKVQISNTTARFKTLSKSCPTSHSFSRGEYPVSQWVWGYLFRVYTPPSLQATTILNSTSYRPETLRNTGTAGKSICKAKEHFRMTCTGKNTIYKNSCNKLSSSLFLKTKNNQKCR